MLQYVLDEGIMDVLPLVDAVHSGRGEIVQVLLDAGADTSFTWFDPLLGHRGNAMDVAFNKKSPFLVELLLGAGAELPVVSRWPLCKGVYQVLRRAQEARGGSKPPEWKVFKKMSPEETGNL